MNRLGNSFFRHFYWMIRTTHVRYVLELSVNTVTDFALDSRKKSEPFVGHEKSREKSMRNMKLT